MVKLNWVAGGWNTPYTFKGVPHSVNFDSLESLMETMSKGEWVTDSKGNRIDIDLRGICLK
ncbi:hypothetical protein ABE208_16240 [Bacillus inaquosorum]|uniref:hypothetical protein n=1 Tax=Bacillus inaquosorum TaxID=483913 RepID=UPI002282E2F8|nr:hypothetical protein [Bacillus inaquosorum]MCY9084304.1 hypothetical protein [Bacillus inaquosorum]